MSWCQRLTLTVFLILACAMWACASPGPTTKPIETAVAASALMATPTPLLTAKPAPEETLVGTARSSPTPTRLPQTGPAAASTSTPTPAATPIPRDTSKGSPRVAPGPSPTSSMTEPQTPYRGPLLYVVEAAIAMKDGKIDYKDRLLGIDPVKGEVQQILVAPGGSQGGTSSAVALSHSGETLLIRYGPHLEVFDTRTGKSYGKLNISGLGGPLVVSPDGRVAYGVRGLTVVGIDLASGKRLLEVDEPICLQSCSSLAIHPEGIYLYAIGQNQLHIVDTRSSALIRTLDLPEPGERTQFPYTQIESWDWHRGLFSPDGKRYYAINGLLTRNSMGIVVVDTQSMEIVQTATLPLTETKGSRSRIGTALSGLFHLFEAKPVYAKGPTPHLAAISGDGRRLYVANLGALAVVDAKTLKLIAVPIRAGQSSVINGVAANHDGSKVFVLIGYRVHVLDGGGDRFTELGVLQTSSYFALLYKP